jgi:hypothetical protein
MKWATRLLQILFITAFSFFLLIMTINHETTVGAPKGKIRHKVKFEPDQFFSTAVGSTIEYNIYIENGGNSMANYSLTALSSQGYSVEVWWDTDQVGGGDIRLIPPLGAELILDAGEVATLIVTVTVPSNATDGIIDSTIIEAGNTLLGTLESVTLTTTINSNQPYPSDWTQLGSDFLFPSPPPLGKTDIKALYCTNNGTHVFVRMAEAESPAPNSFIYDVYLSTKSGGQQIGTYYYDYLLSSDGILYEWNGTDWIDSGYPTYWRVDGTSIILWTDLANLSLETQDIHFHACTTTKDKTRKDELGPFTILRDNISEIPLILIPLVTFAVYIAIFSKRR